MSIETCAFCNLDTLEARIIRAGRLFVSFLSDPLIVEGHALVIPRRHIVAGELWLDDELLACAVEVERLKQCYIKLGYHGVDVWQKTRPHIPEDGVKMDHEHSHVLPSVPDDELYAQGLRWGDRRNWKSLSEHGKSMINSLR